MKTKLLYFEDSYLKEFDAAVVEVKGTAIMLDATAFYYTSGGQPCDTGKIVAGGTEYQVAEVKKENGEIWHYLDKEPAFAAGASVHGAIEWEKRYKLMRMHTAAHVLAGGFLNQQGALITGNQLGVEETRFDFSLEQFDRAKFEELVEQANAKLAEGLEVKTYTMPREEALKMPGMVKLANALPPAISVLRIVDIGGFEVQADGGTHVKNSRECGKIKILRLENKGKNNRRLYFGLE
ncbi:MAG: alanyl-tRNA editing protein AlaXM [Candidatus Micrarchaeia archaeon]|jgi:Ser-tRNA(Ala) deacylase AlaX